MQNRPQLPTRSARNLAADSLQPLAEDFSCARYSPGISCLHGRFSVSSFSEASAEGGEWTLTASPVSARLSFRPTNGVHEKAASHPAEPPGVGGRNDSEMKNHF